MRMRWHDLLFAHWPVDAETLQGLLPKSLPVDTFQGRAWIGVVPFRMSDVAPRGVPAIWGLSAFPELNVRTYVTLDGKPGVWFFSLEATKKIAVRVARRFFHLPYMDARMELTHGDWYDYKSTRTHRGEDPANFEARYRPIGEPFQAQTGSLEHWLTARYCLYVTNRKGRLLRGEIDHPPWPLQRAQAEVQTNTMLEPLGLCAEGAPHLLFAKDLHVQAWTNKTTNI